MILTPAQLTTLRLHPHLTKLYLSIYQPTTVLACRVNNLSSTKGDRLITFDGTSSGSYLLVQSGMTMYVGSSAGAFDKGIVRVRSATSTVLTVAENSHIQWADNDYLTVVNFYEINAIFPRIIQDPADATQTLWYKDYDIAYTDQNSILGSFINMGPHHAGFLENGSCDVYYSASGTYNLLGGAMTYAWFFEGATTTGSSANTPGNISYTTPGHYTTRLIVTGASGEVDTSYRHISIYDRLGGANPPIVDWELTDLTGSRDQGGHTGHIRIHESVPPTLVRDGCLVVIFAEDWYGDKLNKQSIGGNALNRSSIVFVGYVLQGSTKYNYRESTVEFQFGSPSEIMKQAEGFSVSVQYSNNPATATNDPNIPSGWVAVLGMDVRRALYHYLRWHSTVLQTNDFQFIGTDQYLQYFDADRTSVYDAIQSVMKSALVGNVVCDRQGKIWAERDVYVERSIYPATLTLTNQDWMGDAILEERRTPQTSFIEMGGIYFNGPTGEYFPYLSNAPGVSPGYRGKVERIQGLALESQTELNALAGNVFAQRNVTYPNLELDLVGNYRNFDVAPQEILPITLSLTDTIRGITFTNKNFYINRISWRYDPEAESFLPNLTAVEIGPGVPGDPVAIAQVVGDTVVIPEIPVEDSGFGEIDIPEVVIPPFQFGGGGVTNFIWYPVHFTNIFSGTPGAPEVRIPDYGDATWAKYLAGEWDSFVGYVTVPGRVSRITLYSVFWVNHPGVGGYGTYTINATQSITATTITNPRITLASSAYTARPYSFTGLNIDPASIFYSHPSIISWNHAGLVLISLSSSFEPDSTANGYFVGFLLMLG